MSKRQNSKFYNNNKTNFNYIYYNSIIILIMQKMKFDSLRTEIVF